MRPVLATCLMLLATPCLAAAHFHDQPGGGGGGISVPVVQIDSLEEALVVEATEFKVYQAAIDREGKRVSLQGLPPGRYDLLLKFHSTVFEGLSLEVPGGFEELPASDRKYIEGEIFRSEDMFNLKNIARMGGNGKAVKLLVEQVRDKKTFQPDGTVMEGLLVRRLDLTEMRKTGKVWVIKKNRHLFREERKMDGPGRVLKFAYAPDLGGIRVGDETVALPPFDASKVSSRRPPYFYDAQYREKEPPKPR